MLLDTTSLVQTWRETGDEKEVAGGDDGRRHIRDADLPDEERVRQRDGDADEQRLRPQDVPDRRQGRRRHDLLPRVPRHRRALLDGLGKVGRQAQDHL